MGLTEGCNEGVKMAPNWWQTSGCRSRKTEECEGKDGWQAEGQWREEENRWKGRMREANG